MTIRRRTIEQETCVAGRRFTLTSMARGRISLNSMRREWERPPRKLGWSRRPLGMFKRAKWR